METSPYKASVLELVLISKHLALLATAPLLIHATDDTTSLCESYTPGLVCLCDGFGVSVFAEGLYWVAREHHLVYATSNVGLRDTSPLPPAADRFNFQGEMQRIEPSWDFGWRVGLCYTSPCDYWDTFVYWTSYHTNTSEEIDLIDLPAQNLWAYPDNVESARLFAADAKWDLKYDVFDMEFGRAFWIGKSLAFRPHFGIRASWIDQSLGLFYEFEPKNNIEFGAFLTPSSDFSGAGLRSGFDLHFTNGTGLDFYGKVSLALLYGTFKSAFVETETFESTKPQIIADTKDEFNMGVTALQGIIGVNWSKHLCCNRFRLGLHIQWEYNHWSDLNKFPHYQGQLGKGIFREENTALALMGLSFGGSFDF